MLTWFAETRAPHEHGADAEFTVDEVIERDTGRRDVAAGVGSGKLDPAPFSLGVEHAAKNASVVRETADACACDTSRSEAEEARFSGF